MTTWLWLHDGATVHLWGADAEQMRDWLAVVTRPPRRQVYNA
jgi:hypothetical protein